MTAWARLLREGRRAYRATAGNPRIVAAITAAGIAAGTAAWLAGQRPLAGAAWRLVTAVALVPLTASVIRDLLHREPGVDLIALLAMSGALALGQSLAGAVVALMLSGGLTAGASTPAARSTCVWSGKPNPPRRRSSGWRIATLCCSCR